MEVSAVSMGSAVHTFTRSSRNPKPFGITPTTTHGASSSLILEPIALAALSDASSASEKSEACFAGQRFMLCERSPAHGLHAEHVEEVRRHLHRENALGLSIVARQITAAEVVGGDTGERMDAAADVGEFRTRQCEEWNVIARRRQKPHVEG